MHYNAHLVLAKALESVTIILINVGSYLNNCMTHKHDMEGILTQYLCL